MNYIHRKKERNIKKIFLKIYNFFKIRSFNLSFSWKFIIMWVVISAISLFMPWIVNEAQKDTSWNSFNSIWWNIGFLMILLLIFLVFVVVSNTRKEKIKLALGIKIKNCTIIVVIWMFVILNSVIYVSFVNWLSLFLDNIIVGEWIILYMVSWIIITIWGILDWRKYKKRDDESFINEDSKIDWETKLENTQNMKLPF